MEEFLQKDLNAIRRLINNPRKTAEHVKQLFGYLNETALKKEFLSYVKESSLKQNQIEKLCSFLKYDFLSKGETLCTDDCLDENYKYLVLSGEMAMCAEGNFQVMSNQSQRQILTETSETATLMKGITKTRNQVPSKRNLVLENRHDNISHEPVSQTSGNFLKTREFLLHPKELTSQVNIISEILNKKKMTKKLYQKSNRHETILEEPNIFCCGEKFIHRLKQSNFFESFSRADKSVLEKFKESFLKDFTPIDELNLEKIQLTHGKILNSFLPNTLFDFSSVNSFCQKRYSVFAMCNTELIRINLIKIKKMIAEIHIEKFAKIKLLFSKSFNLSINFYGSLIENMCMDAVVL